MITPVRSEPRPAVRRCRKRAAGFLLLLAAAAAFAVPTLTRELLFQRDPRTNLVWKTTRVERGITILPRFLARDRSAFPEEDSYAVRYALRRSLAVKEVRTRLNVPVAAAEAGVLILLAVFDLGFYCPRRRPRPGAGSPLA
jgi:hypothetical protein